MLPAESQPQSDALGALSWSCSSRIRITHQLEPHGRPGKACSAPLFPANLYHAFLCLDPSELQHIAKCRPLGFAVSHVQRCSKFFPPVPQPRLCSSPPQLPRSVQNPAEVCSTSGQPFPTANGSPQGSLRSGGIVHPLREGAGGAGGGGIQDVVCSETALCFWQDSRAFVLKLCLHAFDQTCLTFLVRDSSKTSLIQG